MTNALISFFAATVLASLDLLVLVLATRSMGRSVSSVKLGLLVLGVILKAALLVGGLFYLGHQAWSDKRALLAGVAAPFSLFIVWQLIKLQLRPKRAA